MQPWSGYLLDQFQNLWWVWTTHTSKYKFKNTRFFKTACVTKTFLRCWCFWVLSQYPECSTHRTNSPSWQLIKTHLCSPLWQDQDVMYSSCHQYQCRTCSEAVTWPHEWFCSRKYRRVSPLPAENCLLYRSLPSNVLFFFSFLCTVVFHIPPPANVSMGSKIEET